MQKIPVLPMYLKDSYSGSLEKQFHKLRSCGFHTRGERQILH